MSDLPAPSPPVQSPFHFDDDRPSFESLARQNGEAHWREADLMAALGYESLDSFRRVLRKAMQTCLTLEVETEDNFARKQVIVDGRVEDEYELTRFACYLIAMNGDTRKPGVAAAQAYFAVLAEAFQRIAQNPDSVERILLRRELSAGITSLMGMAGSVGIENFAYFQNAGYRGMYNMNLRALEERKGVPRYKLLDRIGREELAANLFRVTQTEAKIRGENLQGQGDCERAAEAVGRTVRRTMIDLSNTRPEDLPTEPDIALVRGDLKKTSRGFKKLKAAGPKALPATAPQAPPTIEAD